MNHATTHRIALVMIARDEAPRIGRALASARAHVDEMWVLDTGSRDATVAVAEAAGARVAHFVWVDDFAAARNAALALTDADWCLVLDADEWLAGGCEALAELRGQAPTFVGCVRIDSDTDDGTGGTQQAATWISRVLPRGVRYAGRVHEQPQHALPVRRLPLVLAHTGYRADALAAKAGRNRRLLEQEVAEHPGDAYAWYQLGKDHDVYQRPADALGCFARAQALLAGATDAPPAWLHDLVVRRLHAAQCAGRHAEAATEAEAQLAQWQDSPDFFFALGNLLLDWAAREPARASELLPMIEAAWQRCLAIGERPELEGAVAGRGSHLAAHNLAVFYEQLGRPGDAAAARALATAPGR